MPMPLLSFPVFLLPLPLGTLPLPPVPLFPLPLPPIKLRSALAVVPAAAPGPPPLPLVVNTLITTLAAFFTARPNDGRVTRAFDGGHHDLRDDLSVVCFFAEKKIDFCRVFVFVLFFFLFFFSLSLFSFPFHFLSLPPGLLCILNRLSLCLMADKHTRRREPRRSEPIKGTSRDMHSVRSDRKMREPEVQRHRGHSRGVTQRETRDGGRGLGGEGRQRGHGGESLRWTLCLEGIRSPGHKITVSGWTTAVAGGESQVRR